MREPFRWAETRLRALLAAAVVLAALLLAGDFRGARAGDKDEKKNGDPAEGPKIAVEFNPAMGFGLQILDSKGQKQKITYDPQGKTNLVLITVDGKKYVFGAKEGDRLPDDIYGGTCDPMKAALGKGRKGLKSVFVTEGKVRITQMVEIVSSSKGKDDTCLVTYAVENKDDKGHKVGIRVLVDTFIATNDGHPFAVPGRNRLITTSADFKVAKGIPPVVQALQRPDLKDPGLVAYFTFKPGGTVDGPERVSLTHLPLKQEDAIGWVIPVRNIKIDDDDPGDACVVMYWEPRDVARGGRRVVGYAYGGGPLAAAAPKKVEEPKDKDKEP
jgi:hypothetical protein